MVLSPVQLRANLLVKLGEVTGRTHVLPLALFAPTSRCNSRCVSCDWWRADGADDLTLDEIRKMADDLTRFGTRLVVFTGGEPLVRTDVMEVADIFRARGIALHLLTSGLALERFAAAIATRFEEVTISLDGHTSELYREIRGVNGLEAVSAGVRRLRALAPHILVRARTTLHRHNFRFLPQLVAKARELDISQISFLTADVTSDSFNRSPKLAQVREEGSAAPSAAPSLLLTDDETVEFARVVEAVIVSHQQDLAERRVVPGPAGLRRLVQYYRAHLGLAPFPTVDCNAPWASVVIESNGAVRPCFFHPPVGNIRQRSLPDLLAKAMPKFRARLEVATDRTCQRCVCTLNVGLRSKLW